jgi:hypothetical protein
MRSPRNFLLVSIIGMIFVAGAAAADQPATTSASAAAAAQAAPIPENAAEIAAIASGELVLEPLPAAEAAGPQALTPEMVEITAALAAEREQVNDLTYRLPTAADDATALALEQQIETAKQGAEIAILGIQARYARAAGREEQAQAIEAAIAQMTSVMNIIPVAAVPPAVSPAPRPADGSR